MEMRAGAEGGNARYSARWAGFRVATRSERTWRVKVTTHAERAQSVSVGAKIGSSSVVDTHQRRDKVGFGLVFFGAGQRKPMICGHAARFARVEGEVRKIQSRRFLEGDFFEGNANAKSINT